MILTELLDRLVLHVSSALAVIDINCVRTYVYMCVSLHVFIQKLIAESPIQTNKSYRYTLQGKFWNSTIKKELEKHIGRNMALIVPMP